MTNYQGVCTRRHFLKQSSLAGFALAACPSKVYRKKPEKRPNIILIVTDDQRWDSLGCMGNPIIHTPHLDRMAAEGILFRNHFSTTSICMSSRASIFTGLYTRCHGIDEFTKPLSPGRFLDSYPAKLRQAGYRTAFVVKWGLGGELPKNDFDYFEGFPGQGEYFQLIDGKEVHLTRRIAEQACEFLQTDMNGEPFCLSISTKAPHVQDGHPDPYRYDPQYKDLYVNDTIPTPETADPCYFEALPDFIRGSEGRTRWQTRFSTPELYQHSVKNYYRLVTGIDTLVGAVRDRLERLRLSDNTVILFTSDQGCFIGEHGLAGKWLMHEESIRAPLVVYDPRLPEKRHGIRDAMTLNLDFAPTLLDLAGVEIPPYMQGQSLIPLVNEHKKILRREWFYEHPYGHAGKIPKSEGIRSERWKYIRYYETDPLYEELYDLQKDPLETTNLATNPDYQSIRDRYRQRWHIWRDSLAAWKSDPRHRWCDPKS